MEEDERNEWGPRGQPSASEQLKISGYTEENKEEYVPKAIRAEQEKKQKAWDNPYFVEAYDTAMKNLPALTQNQKNLLDHYGFDFYKSGNTEAKGINAALTLGPFAAKAPVIAGGIMKGANLLKAHPGKAFTTVMQGVGAHDIVNNPEDLAFETLGQKMDTVGNLTTLKPRGMLVTGKELAKKIDNWLGKDFDLFNPKGLFNRRQPITPEGVRIDANDIDVNPNIMQSKGGGGGFKPEGNWQSKYTKNFSDTSKLQKYEEAAFKYRELRHQTAKKDLMKGFIFEDGKPYITGDDGKKYLLVRRTSRVDEKNFISNKNYHLLPEDVILDRLLRKSGWTPGSRELREIKRALNKQNFSLLSNPKYYEPLIEHGVGNVYLEHKIARGQSWFWNEVAKNSDFAPWLDKVMGPDLRKLGRNSEYNIRILFNQDYKHLKDGVEKQLDVINSNKKIGEKFIINIEDPQHVASSGDVDFAKMNNPGNISVLKAGTGEKVGVIPDYLMNLYSNDFTKKWKNNYKYLINRPGNEVPKFYRIYTKKVKDPTSGKMVQRYETLEEWRKRVVGERIDLILRKSDDTDAFEIGKHVIADRGDFFEIFDQRSGWIEPPSTIRNEPEFLNDR